MILLASPRYHFVILDSIKQITHYPRQNGSLQKRFGPNMLRISWKSSTLCDKATWPLTRIGTNNGSLTLILWVTACGQDTLTAKKWLYAIIIQWEDFSRANGPRFGRAARVEPAGPLR